MVPGTAPGRIPAEQSPALPRLRLRRWDGRAGASHAGLRPWIPVLQPRQPLTCLNQVLTLPANPSGPQTRLSVSSQGRALPQPGPRPRGARPPLSSGSRRWALLGSWPLPFKASVLGSSLREAWALCSKQSTSSPAAPHPGSPTALPPGSSLWALRPLPCGSVTPHSCSSGLGPRRAGVTALHPPLGAVPSWEPSPACSFPGPVRGWLSSQPASMPPGRARCPLCTCTEPSSPAGLPTPSPEPLPTGSCDRDCRRLCLSPLGDTSQGSLSPLRKWAARDLLLKRHRPRPWGAAGAQTAGGHAEAGPLERPHAGPGGTDWPRAHAENQEGAATHPPTPELLGEGGRHPGPHGARLSSALPLGPPAQRPAEPEGGALSDGGRGAHEGLWAATPADLPGWGGGRGHRGGHSDGTAGSMRHAGGWTPRRREGSLGEPRLHRLAQPRCQSRGVGPRGRVAVFPAQV